MLVTRVILTLQLATASYVAPLSHRRVVATRGAAVVACAAEASAKEFFDDAKNEEEAQFDEELAVAATKARSPEAIEALRQAAEAALAELRAADAPEVAAALETRGKAKPAGKLEKALRKPSKTMALVGEGFTLETISLGGFELNDPAYISEQVRTGGGSAVLVRGAGVDGELCAAALAATTAEQETARGNFPGPLPAIARDLVVDELQLAAAKAGGATGVLLPLALNGPEKTGELMTTAAELGLETLVRVCDAEELAAALALEAKIVVIGDCTLAEAAELRATLPDGKAGPVSVADVPFLDVRGGWKIRDAGFNAMVAGKSLLEVVVRDRVPPSSICKALLSKGSVKYGLGMQKGRLEGSKEFLGSMAM